MKVDTYGVLIHTYYGAAVGQEDMSYLVDLRDSGFSGNIYEAGNKRDYSLDTLPRSIPAAVWAITGFPASAFAIPTDPTQWTCGTGPMRLFRENMTFPGLPALYGNPEDADTLKITLKDPVTGLRAVLYYSVWEKQDIITRSVRFYNENENPIILKKAVSMNLDLMHGQWELIHFTDATAWSGRWSGFR